MSRLCSLAATMQLLTTRNHPFLFILPSKKQTDEKNPQKRCTFYSRAHACKERGGGGQQKKPQKPKRVLSKENDSEERFQAKAYLCYLEASLKQLLEASNSACMY